MAGAGSKVLALRSVEFARNHGVVAARAVGVHVGAGHVGHRRRRRVTTRGSVPWKIRSSPVSSPTASESKVTVLGVPDRPGISASLFEPLADANVNVDMIVQNTSTEGTTDISFTMPSADMDVAEDIVERVAGEIGATGVTHDSDIAKLSLVGAGMKSSPGIAAKMFRTLADEGVNIEMISTSTIRISVVIATADLERAARALAHRLRPRQRHRLRRPAPRTPLSRCCPQAIGRGIGRFTVTCTANLSTLRCEIDLWTGCSTSRASSWSASRSPPLLAHRRGGAADGRGRRHRSALVAGALAVVGIVDQDMTWWPLLGPALAVGDRGR